MLQNLRRRLLPFLLMLSVLLPNLVVSVSAAGCAAPSIMFGRYKWCGYWYNRFEDSGDPVRTGGVPSSVNTVQSFINLILGDLAGDAKHQTEAKFVIRTMLGSPYYTLPNPAQAVGSAKTPLNASDPNVARWENELRTYSNISENGNTSTGQNGSINWFFTQHLGCGVDNSYWQPSFNDIAPYQNNTGNSDCGDPNSRDVYIVVRDTSGNVIYTIRRACMNPMGNLGKLSQTPLNSYTLTPDVTTSASTVVAGMPVTFTYAVHYSGSSSATGINCSIYANTHAGTISPNPPSPAETSGSNPGVNTGCPRTFNSGTQGTIATETVNNLPANSTVCRTLTVTPARNGSGTAADEACVQVVNKPYVSVTGGDVMAGSGFGDSCTEPSAVIKSWNLNTTTIPNYYGAGSDIGAWATGNITDFVSGMGLSGGAASGNGYGLSFANTTNLGGGGYGGNFGANAVPCQPDYYGTRPGAGVGSLPSGVTSLSGDSGNYNGQLDASGTFTLGGGGNITLGQDGSGAGQQVTIYVSGNVYIKSNILYNYSSIYQIPRLNLYVRGNIYIDPSVTELHGVFTAQKANSSTGYITTCASGANTNPLPYATCNRQLKIVGSVDAESGIRMTRTYGNLVAASGVTNQPAEIFEYSPELWMSAPTGSGFKYQSYTSLPPVL